jgi:deoxyribonuclease-4
VNLAAAEGSTKNIKLSTETLLNELNRCRMLGIPFLIVHPGSHGGDGEVSGVERVVSRIESVLKQFDGDTVLLVETTAGQGNGIGYRFEHIRDIIGGIRDSRIGSCIDTCHIFSAGYDIRTGKSLLRTIREFNRIVGFEYVKVLHLNDSKGALGSRIDRHTHIGRGEIGVEPFSLIMRDRRFALIPKIIETPKKLEGQDMDGRNLDLLRNFAKTSHKGKRYSKPGEVFNER